MWDKIIIHCLLKFVATIPQALFVSEDASRRFFQTQFPFVFDALNLLMFYSLDVLGRSLVKQLSICNGYIELIKFNYFINNFSFHLSVLSMYYSVLYRGLSGSDLLVD